MGVCVQTVRNIFHRYGFRSHLQVRTPFISKKNQVLRLKWAKIHVGCTANMRRTVLFSDESPYTLRYSNKRKIWRLNSERFHKMCLKATVKHDQKIMVWGCFASNGVGQLYQVDGIMKKEQYKKILEDYMQPSAEKLFGEKNYFIFQHDNDPKHTAKIIKKYLKEQHFHTMWWPAQSRILILLRICGIYWTKV